MDMLTKNSFIFPLSYPFFNLTNISSLNSKIKTSKSSNRNKSKWEIKDIWFRRKQLMILCKNKNRSQKKEIIGTIILYFTITRLVYLHLLIYFLMILLKIPLKKIQGIPFKYIGTIRYRLANFT